MTTKVNLEASQKILSNFLNPQMYDDKEAFKEMEEAIMLITHENLALTEYQLILLLDMTMRIIEVFNIVSDHEDPEIKDTVLQMHHDAILFLEYLSATVDDNEQTMQLS